MTLKSNRRRLQIVWGLLLLLFGVCFFIYPMVTTAYYVAADKGLRSPVGSPVAFRWHERLSGRYQKYAERRVESGVAGTLSQQDISGTEWPLFGSVFYLWATAQLQEAWDADPSLAKVSPKEYARGAVEAATALVLDPVHATWVETHWGPDFMTRENVFYRMLVMSAIIAHHDLTGSDRHLALLREQVETFSAELDASPFGLLDDYPHQCFPGDVLAALAAIARADRILGTDHSAMLARAARGFEGEQAGPLGLPPYAAGALSGKPYDPSRGCSNSYLCTTGPDVWPERTAAWYASYTEHFWQSGFFAAGFREFPDGWGKAWYFDVDAGPVIDGLGSAASAFGLAAARKNGDYSRAFPLAAQMIAASWPLPRGRLLVPWLISDGQHAPHLGEAAVLYQLSSQPHPKMIPLPGYAQTGFVPGSVWLLWLVQLTLGGLLVRRGLRGIRRAG